MSSQPPTTPQSNLPGHRNPPPPAPVGNLIGPALTYLRAKAAAAKIDPDTTAIVRMYHLDTLLESYEEHLQELTRLKQVLDSSIPDGIQRFEQSVTNCARCGENHEELSFRAFSQPGPADATYWATCPVTGDPILLDVKDYTPLMEPLS